MRVTARQVRFYLDMLGEEDEVKFYLFEKGIVSSVSVELTLEEEGDLNVASVEEDLSKMVLNVDLVKKEA